MSTDQFMPDLNCRWRVTEEGYQIEFDGEYWELRDVAAAVWSGIVDGQSLQQITRELTSKYAAPTEDIASDIRDFVHGLCVDGLVHEESR